MAKNTDNGKKPNPESSLQNQASTKSAKKRKGVPVFKEDELYKVKYDF